MKRPLFETAPQTRGAFLYFVVVNLVIAGLVLAAFINYQGDAARDRAADEANKARDETTAALLDCFDVLLGRTAVRSNKIGDAAERVTTTTLARDKAKYKWIALLNRALAMNPEEGSDEAIAIGIRFQKRTSILLTAQKEVIAAQEHQERVRDRYPVPPPPSKFCVVAKP